jgi:5'-nucleotidase / UDP-sugar diphosphatase
MKRFYLAVLLLLFVQFSYAQPDAVEKKLTILYTNDLHAHVEPHKVSWIDNTRLVGGFVNIATLVKKEKAQNHNTVYFDAGDFFTGPYISSLTKGEAVIDLMNYLSLDAVCIGNHEFDHGWQNVPEQFAKAKFPILNGNIFLKGSRKLIWNNPYTIITINGVRIGVIGLHGRFAFYDTIADEMIQGVEARDEEYYLAKYIKKLRKKTDLIVLLIHQGVPGRQSSAGGNDVARNLQKDIELAQKVPGVDIIVTGHAHQGTPEPLISNGTIIVSTDAYTTELGRLEISYNQKLDKITSYKNTLQYLFDDEVPDDSATVSAVQQWKKKLENITNEKVCNLSGPLTRSYGEESPLGNMVADAMLYAYPGNDFAVNNSGGLRQDVDAGVVTVGNLISAFPFPNTVIQMVINGNDLRTLFEHGAGLTNGILQVSKGVELVYDENRPAGSRIISCNINGKPLDDKAQYKVLTSNFLADGGDGFLAFKNAVSRKKTNVEIVQTMINYLKTFETYNPKLEGRVRRVK